jgi:hypothetical protein
MRQPEWRCLMRVSIGCISMQSPTQLGAMTKIFVMGEIVAFVGRVTLR